MKNYIGVFLGVFASLVINAQNQKRDTEHFKATYNHETEIYAIASLELLETVWTIASDNGFNLPQKIRFSIEKSDRNALYFNRKSLKGITWEYESLAEFMPPDQGGKNCIYGLCHEIGHLCMHNTNNNRNSWMSLNYREGWADYFGNMIVDSLYNEHGTDIWPNPHNFKKYAGMEYFHNRLEEDNPKLQSFNNASQFWYDLGSEIGFNNIQLFFDTIKTDKVDNPGAREKFNKVLEEYLKKQDIEGWFEQFVDDLIINKE